jgi:hypothetical protein
VTLSEERYSINIQLNLSYKTQIFDLDNEEVRAVTFFPLINSAYNFNLYIKGNYS